MKRLASFGCIVAILLTAMPATARASIAVVKGELYNQSDACVWITYYWSYKSEAHWRIGASGWVAPGHRDARFSEIFNFPSLGPQVRIRTQVMSTANGACTGDTGRPDIQLQFNFSPKGLSKTEYCKAGAKLVGSRSAGYRLESWSSFDPSGECS